MSKKLLKLTSEEEETAGTETPTNTTKLGKDDFKGQSTTVPKVEKPVPPKLGDIPTILFSSSYNLSELNLPPVDVVSLREEDSE